MFQPHSVIYDSRFIYVLRHEKGDYRHTPVGQRLNPLRYQITIFPGRAYRIVINRNGRLNLHWSNLNWFLWRKRWRAFIKARSLRAAAQKDAS